MVYSSIMRTIASSSSIECVDKAEMDLEITRRLSLLLAVFANNYAQVR